MTLKNISRRNRRNRAEKDVTLLDQVSAQDTSSSGIFFETSAAQSLVASENSTRQSMSFTKPTEAATAFVIKVLYYNGNIC